MQDLKVLLSLIATIVGFVTSTITFIIKFVSSENAKRENEDTIKIRNALLSFIAEAEKLNGLSGEEKKAYVLAKVQKFSRTKKIKYNEQKTSDKIDEIVALTKMVNVKNKKKK